MSEKKAFETWWAQYGAGNMTQQYQAWHSALEWAGSEQEPVAWLCTETKVLYSTDTAEVDKYHGFKPTVPLYTHPAVAVNEIYREALEKIATVNAMDYEYQRWARDAIAAAEAAKGGV